MPPGRRNLKRALGGFLAFYLFEIRPKCGLLDCSRCGRSKQAVPFEVIDQGEHVGRGDHVDLARPGRFGTLGRGADQPLAFAQGMDCGEQHAGRGGDTAIEPKLADDDVIGQRLGIDHAHRRQ